MTKFRPAVMTDAGQSLATQAEAGEIKLTFTRGVLSSDDLTQLSQTAVQQTTSLDPFITCTINKSIILSANKVALPLSFSNEQMTSDNYAKTVGIYANDGTTEYLYAICINDAPLLLSAYNGSTPEALEIEFRTEVGRATTVNVTVSPLDTVNRDELQTAINKLKTIGGLSDSDDILNLSEDGHYIVGGANPKNNPWGKQIWADIYKTDFGLVIRDNVGHEYIRSNYDSVWKRTLNDTEDLNNINNELANVNNAIAQVESDAKYNEVGQLQDSDDVLNLPKNGHYVINGTDPKNNPWGKQIWADVYKTTYLTVLRDNEGAEFIRSYYDNTWKRTLNSIDQQYLEESMASIASSVSGLDQNGISSVASSVSSYALSEAQYNEVGQLSDNDDVLNLPKNGHYTISGTNPKNNPWGKDIWADVYKTNFQIICRDNVGAEFIRSYYDSTWKRTINNDDGNSLASAISSLATSGNNATNSVADSIGTWIVNGFNSLGGSETYLNEQNNSRISEVGSLNSYIQTVEADKNLRIYTSDHHKDMNSLADSVSSEMATKVTFSDGNITTGYGTFVPAAIGQAYYNFVAELQSSDDILALPQNGHYVVRGANPINNPWSKTIWGDVYKTDYNIVMRDNVGGEFIRSNYDSVWKRTINTVDLDSINTQLNALNAQTNTAISKAQYNITGYLLDSDDLFNLPGKGHYVIGGANPKNNPWGKAIWADVYSNEFSLIVYDNVGGMFIKTTSGWRGL